MAIVMLALVGDQPMPNIIAPLQYRPRPERLELLVTDEEYQQIADNIARVLQDKMTCCQTKVRPFDVGDVQKVCRQIVAKCQKAGENLVFNLTGGTKTMALAAYQVAAEFDKTALYVETGEEKIIYLIPSDRPKEPIRVSGLKVEDYLLAHNVNVKLDKKTDRARQLPPHLYRAATYLATEAPRNYLAMDLLRYGLRQERERQKDQDPMSIAWSRDKLMRAIRDGWPADTENSFYQLLTDLSHPQHGAIAAYERDGATGKMRLKVTHAQHDFLKGDWLEYYVFQEAYKQGFDDCRAGLDVDWRERWLALESAGDGLPKNDLDVVTLRGTIMTICSCKSGRVGKADARQASGRQAIYELETIARSVGLYCHKVLAISRPDFESRGDISKNLIKRALILGIAPVTARDLPRIGEIMENPGGQIEHWKKRL